MKINGIYCNIVNSKGVISVEFVYGNPDDVGMSAAKIDYVKGLVPKWIGQGITPAFTGFVARKGVVVFNEAFGKLTPEEKSPEMQTDTIFPLCSITKILTSIAAMVLLEDGLLSINRPVSWYIPEFAGEGKDQVMVHQLLTHTSGLQDCTLDTHMDKKYKAYENGEINLPAPEKNQGPGMAEYLYLSYDVPLSRRPGEFMSYCNYNMVLMGEIIRRVSGCSLDSFYKERIFDPLGMKDTYLIVPKEVWHRVVKFPDDSEHGRWLSCERHFASQSPAGGAYSTVRDMAVLAQMILNKGIYNGVRILSPLTVKRMTYDRLPGISAQYGNEIIPTASWGLGWNIFGDKLDVESGGLQSREAFGHGGAGRSMLWIDPVYDVVGVIFYVKMPPEYRRPDDLFRNAVMSAIYQE